MAAHFLDSEHEIYTQWKQEWRRNERRSAGGTAVLKELHAFQYEREGGDQHQARKDQASYLNFMDEAGRALSGHLARQAPEPDHGLQFGTLGRVTREEGQSDPSRAELLYYNADGVGRDGSQWDAWWSSAIRRAMHTGHRWIFVDAPKERPTTLQHILDGRRPYLREFSPLAVRDWHYEAGRLQYAIARFRHRKPRIQGGQFSQNSGQGYLLLVRRGFDGLGAEYSGGGWWKFSPKKESLDHGDWEGTGGDIPMAPLFYERWEGTEDIPAISRPGTTEVGQVAVAYMNLASAARFDAWSAGASMTFLLGVTPDQYRVAADKLLEGSLLIPVPPVPETGAVPQVYDASSGAVVQGVFDGLLSGLREEAQELTMKEATSAPESSGESKRMGFGELKSPRLADMAQNLETAQNTALYFLEKRFMTAGQGEPTASVRWPREFDLRELVDDIRAHMDLERTSGLRSKTVGVKGMVQAARQHRVIESDEELETVKEEYEAAFDRREENESRAGRLGAELGIDGF